MNFIGTFSYGLDIQSFRITRIAAILKGDKTSSTFKNKLLWFDYFCLTIWYFKYIRFTNLDPHRINH